MREIIFDTETTGFYPENGDRVIEIGCVEIIDGVPTGKTFHTMLNPERDIPAESTRIHGITNEKVTQAPIFKHVLDDFLSFIGDAPLVAHNAEFDRKFINAEFTRLAMPTLPMSRFIDTLMLAKAKFPGQRASLDALAAKFNVDTSARTVHGALIDSFILADVYVELLGGRQRGFDLGADAAQIAAPTAAHAASPHSGNNTVRAARHFPASAAEIQAHLAFVQKLKKPLWAKYLNFDPS